MLVSRPAGPADFDSLMELAVLSGRGFTSLPADEPTLRTRLDVSARSFAGDIAPLEAWYTLLLEDTETGIVGGSAAVKGAVGLKRPHFSFRVVTLAQSSPFLQMRFDHQALVLVNECAGWSEVGSLFLRADQRAGGAGRLLAQSRYLLIAAEPERFADTVISELRGWFDEDGTCPFWETVGCRFFRLPFDQADLMSASTDGQFILDLSPRHPIYVELLPEPARSRIGAVHRDGEAALAMLKKEGFRPSNLIDIFDAGPTLVCARDDIRSVRDSFLRRVEIAAEPPEGAPALLARNAMPDYRATRGPVALGPETVAISAETAQALRVRAGDTIRVKV